MENQSTTILNQNAMTPLTLPSPCKLNLFLHINGRRPDGYHELQTLFQLLDYGDTLTFSPHDSICLETPLSGVPDEENIVVKAAQLLKQATGTPLGARIKLTKRIPMGGGLGGGSSNAATTLLGLNALWRTQIPVPTLMTLGKQLGADVPVFILGHTAWGEGIGEVLTPVTRPSCWFLVVKPDCHVSTAEIFSNKGLTRDTPKMKIAPALEGQQSVFKNDFQEIVLKEYPQVAKAMNWLDQFASARLTGTGACIFAEFSDKVAASKALEKLPDDFEGFVAKGVNKSPLHEALETC